MNLSDYSKMNSPRTLFVVLCFATALVTGCSDDEFAVAPVNGVVKCNGEIVGGGVVYFQPKQVGDSAVVGKIGLGVIDSQGQFTVSTYGTGDGAVVGTHIVKVGKGSGPGCDCAMNADRMVMEVEVTSGPENTIEIELPKKTRQDARAEQLEADEDDDDDDE
ncbi:hypothetical protein RISK_002789 [Rhodopirellula islandica]|uniref:Carboxypeptidase regulatory-like domain-containing protein n=2 Tax=Rhodopirellula islandica TaxID=595434 RepID=A0A0J1BEL7_RHOIS|nr:hypothetical protein RISK_002789 [Rhodopirellula islandica]